jgi:hypothetical protein
MNASLIEKTSEQSVKTAKISGAGWLVLLRDLEI